MTRGIPHDRDFLVPQICKRLSASEPLAKICRDLKVDRTIVYDWMADDPEVEARIKEARDEGFDNLAAECLEIADNVEEGEVIVDKGGGKKEVQKGDMLGHRKLRIETRLKLLAKWDPKRYGERIKQDVEHSGGITVRLDATDSAL